MSVKEKINNILSSIDAILYETKIQKRGSKKKLSRSDVNNFYKRENSCDIYNLVYDFYVEQCGLIVAYNNQKKLLYPVH